MSLYAIAILAGPIYSVLGGFVEQLEELEGAFYNDAEGGLDDLGATDASVWAASNYALSSWKILMSAESLDRFPNPDQRRRRNCERGSRSFGNVG